MIWLLLHLSLGAQSIQKVSALAVDRDGPVRAELLPSGNEVLIEATGRGIGHVFLFDRHELRVIEVAVDVEPPPPGPVPACETVKDAACYEQFRRHPMPRMTFELEGLQAEARAAQKLLDDAGLKVTVGLSPWGVKLKGAKDEAETRKALVAIWPAILGPLRFDE
ncbi:MAG TPA: hypothetical protein VLW85_12680 [Myxococcales bacterium]|nr:hypothetical protein [Myxococcales bacterium]